MNSEEFERLRCLRQMRAHKNAEIRDKILNALQDNESQIELATALHILDTVKEVLMSKAIVK